MEQSRQMNQSENEVMRRLHSQNRGLFQNNQTIKGAKVKISRKPEKQPFQQIPRPVPVHLTEAVLAEIQKTRGHTEKLEKVTQNTFISPAVITVKKDKTAKVALDSGK